MRRIENQRANAIPQHGGASGDSRTPLRPDLQTESAVEKAGFLGVRAAKMFARTGALPHKV
jgi:hypothetical protein